MRAALSSFIPGPWSAFRDGRRRRGILSLPPAAGEICAQGSSSPCGAVAARVADAPRGPGGGGNSSAPAAFTFLRPLRPGLQAGAVLHAPDDGEIG